MEQHSEEREFSQTSFLPTPDTFAHQEWYYVSTRLLGPRSMYVANSFMTPHYIPFPERESLFRCFEYLLHSRKDLLQVIAREVDLLSLQTTTVTSTTDTAKTEVQAFWAKIGKKELTSASIPSTTAAQFEQQLAKWIHVLRSSSPYFNFSVPDRRWMCQVVRSVADHLSAWSIEYPNPNRQPIHEWEVKNRYEQLTKEGGYHLAWNRLQIRHPLDIFASLFLLNDLRREVYLFLMLFLYRVILLYNQQGYGCPAYLHPMETIEQLLTNQLRVSFMEIHFRCPTINPLLSNLIQEGYEFMIDQSISYEESIANKPPIPIYQQVLSISNVFIVS
jgi:hypothetical protein